MRCEGQGMRIRRRESKRSSSKTEWFPRSIGVTSGCLLITYFLKTMNWWMYLLRYQDTLEQREREQAGCFINMRTVGLCRTQGELAPSPWSICDGDFFPTKSTQWYMADCFVRLLFLKKTFPKKQMMYLQWSDNRQAIPTILVESAISHLLVWIFISTPVAWWLLIVFAVNSLDGMLRTSPTVFKAQHSQRYLKNPFITTTLDQC